MQPDGFNFDKIAIADSASLRPNWEISNGHFGAEAELAEIFGAGTNGDAWVERTTTTGFEVSGYLLADPDDGSSATSPPTSGGRFRFLVDFPAIGNYDLWLRASGVTDGQTAWVSIEGDTARQIRWTGTAWVWANQDENTSSVAFFVNSTGTKSVDVYIREDGARIDRLIVHPRHRQ